MSDDTDGQTYDIDPISDEEKEIAVLEPQQHSLITQNFAQSMLLAGFDKKRGTFATTVQDAIKAAVHLSSHVLDPQTLNGYYENHCKPEGRNNPYRDAVRIKHQKSLEDQN